LRVLGEEFILQKRFYIVYALLLCIFLSAIIPVKAIEQNIDEASCAHINNQVFNEYIAAMIKNREPEIRAAVINGEEITDFRLNDAIFDIENGKLLIKFTVRYKESDITGAIGVEPRVSIDAPQQIGGYCLGLEGGLHSSNILTNIILAFTTNHLNKSLAGKEFWPDKHNHPQFQTFKNSNLTSIINQAFVTNGAVNKQFPKISKPVLGGTMQVEFNDIICHSFDISTGQAEIDSKISMNLKTQFGEPSNFPNAGTLAAFFDFYLNPVDKSWWAKLSNLKLNMNLAGSELNSMAQKMIDKQLKAHQVFIPLDMPKPIQ
jgi:hypothetical protein